MPKQQEPHSIQAWSLINRKYLGKGIRVKRFRKPSRCQIRNRVLLAVLMANDIKLSQLAEDISVSSRSVSAWVYEGRIPGKKNLDKVCQYLGYPHHILFNHTVTSTSPIICQPSSSRFMRRTLTRSPVSNKILTGLCMVHDLSVSDVSEWMDIHPGTFRKWLHQGTLPSASFQDRAEQFFRIPKFILFADCILQDEES
ncbi:helix-turn-helix domain-containing protein [Paenibacillus cellulositrophicus]|jgi:transcriptional regulator with XRE-family HTH domain|uniref:Transcriptional regulator n=3 Tax=Paenibacillus TaxID=44249 RepID=A0A1R1ERF0_9BACL|nr:MULTISPECIES: helix-turn-helix transcriptional regulator [Paenibacillus]MBB3128932.1 transcriptional regulator with XRE-family HTH domain [Paenibacillus rhizosphaerae]MBJ9989059.1 XRE family transcriptional regulator [Paenibacillus sp. S28]MCM2996740.1 XRE family transcriptional regulator [Paenibacillus cellulositrophicus]MEC0178018.1 helix-turn-helix transcriptional regulator [Paenibacillus favisporus]OMF54371.1 transcriptional regulator [Paenibacillus rhizosphaerae]